MSFEEMLHGAIDVDELAAEVNTRILKRGVKTSFSWEMLAASKLREGGKYVSKPRSAEWLRARKKFVKRWERMEKDGLASGFLDYEYEAGVVPTTDKFVSEWVAD